jgi:hypothetical protein
VADDKGPSNYLLHVVIWLLALAVAAQILLVFGRGFGCLYWGVRCSESEFTAAADQLAGVTATIVALVFAALKGRE